MTSTKIKIGVEHYGEIRDAMRQFNIKHGPFHKRGGKYVIDIYPTKHDYLFLVKLSDTDIEVMRM